MFISLNLLTIETKQAFDLSTIPRHSIYTHTLKALLKGYPNGTIIIFLQLDYPFPAFQFKLLSAVLTGAPSIVSLALSLAVESQKVTDFCSLMNIRLANSRPSFTEWSWQFFNTHFSYSSDVSLLSHLSLVLYIPHLH